MSTKIEWCDETWNPTVGCTRVSAGCEHCYAEGLSRRFYRGLTTASGRWNGKVALFQDRLTKPLRWRKPRRVFVNSMSDLFQESIPDAFIDRVFAVMALAPQHTFIVLTKRSERMRNYMTGADLYPRVVREANKFRDWRPRLDNVGISNPSTRPLRWVHLGVSVEDQRTADERIPLLLQTPAAVRIVSYEPALGPVDFMPWLRIAWQCSGCRGYFAGCWQKICPTCSREDYWTGSHALNQLTGSLPSQVGSGLDQIIVGGESGPGARRCDVGWVRSVVEQCRAAGVACFVKQLGSSAGLRDSKGGDMAEWPEALRVREFARRREG